MLEVLIFNAALFLIVFLIGYHDSRYLLLELKGHMLSSGDKGSMYFSNVLSIFLLENVFSNRSCNILDKTFCLIFYRSYIVASTGKPTPKR